MLGGALICVRIAQHRDTVLVLPFPLKASLEIGPDLFADHTTPRVEYEQITSFVLSTLIAARCVHRLGDHRSP